VSRTNPAARLIAVARDFGAHPERMESCDRESL